MNTDAHRLLAISSIQRLWPQRYDHGLRREAPARLAIRQWIRDLRRLAS